MFAGPVAWLISTQLNYSLAASLCGPLGGTIGAAAIGLILLSLAGGAVSLSYWRAQPAGLSLEDTTTRIPDKLIAGAGILMGLLFAAVIALQGSAALFLDGCAR